MHRTTLRDFQLRPRETFLYTCEGMDLWEWEFRVFDSQVGGKGDEVPVCLAGRGASPPEFSGGNLWAVVSAVPSSSESCVTTRFLLLSTNLG